jgi:hypothetical protein
MSLSLAIAINAIADIALAGLLAFVMSQAGRLKPHMQTAAAVSPQPAQRTNRPPTARPAMLSGAPLAARG